MFCAQLTPNPSANTFATTFLAYTTSTEACKQAKVEKIEKNSSHKGIHKGKQANCVTVHLHHTKNSLRGARSARNSKTTLHTHSTSSFEPFSSYTTRQTRSANKQKSKKSKKTASKGIHKGKQANSQKGHFAEAKQRTRRSQKHATRDKPSFHTLYKPWRTFVHIQSISNEIRKHAKS